MSMSRIQMVVAASLIILPGCLRETDLDPKTEPKVVVQCILAFPQEEQELYLCSSIAPGGDRGTPIDEGTAILTDLTTGMEAGVFNPCGEGRWTLDYQVVPGHEYGLEVTVPGYSPIQAKTRVPDQYRVHYQHHALSGTYWDGEKGEFYSEGSDSNLYWSGTRFYADDFGTEALWVFSWNYDPLTGLISLGHKLGTTCPGVDPFNLTGEPMSSPELIKDFEYNKGVYFFHMFSHSRYHQNYLRIPDPGSCKWEETEYFSASHDKIFKRRQLTFFYVEGDLTEGYEGVPERVEPTSYGELAYEDPAAEPLQRQSCMEMMTVSDEYDRYMKEIISYEQRQREGDLTVLYDRENIYSNITGGVGIFGARISYYLPWKESGKSNFPW